MRLFADHCIPTDLVDALRAMGLPVERAHAVGLARASDDELFAYALKTRQVLLTLDRDFGNLVRFEISRSRGIVILQVGRTSSTLITQRACEFFQRTNERALRGSLCFIEPGRVRIWRKRRT